MYNYINLPYSMIEDSLIDISEEEINNYYNKNKSDYKQDLSKDIDYVVFTVVPSNEDDLETRSALTNLKDDFEVLNRTYFKTVILIIEILFLILGKKMIFQMILYLLS